MRRLKSLGRNDSFKPQMDTDERRCGGQASIPTEPTQSPTLDRYQSSFWGCDTFCLICVHLCPSAVYLLKIPAQGLFENPPGKDNQHKNGRIGSRLNRDFLPSVPRTLRVLRARLLHEIA